MRLFNNSKLDELSIDVEKLNGLLQGSKSFYSDYDNFKYSAKLRGTYGLIDEVRTLRDEVAYLKKSNAKLNSIVNLIMDKLCVKYVPNVPDDVKGEYPKLVKKVSKKV